MSNALEQLVVGMTLRAARVRSRRILKEIQKAGTRVES